jgi:hypothetical protein
VNATLHGSVGALVILASMAWGISSLAAPPSKTAVQHFICNAGYTPSVCKTEMDVLRKTVARYPTAALGEWTWILIQNEDWRPILKSRGFNPNSPAFTVLGERETFVEEALVLRVSVRGFKLKEVWGMPMDELLDLAVRHEMGHGLCNEKDEENASRAAALLREGKPVSCDGNWAEATPAHDLGNRQHRRLLIGNQP